MHRETLEPGGEDGWVLWGHVVLTSTAGEYRRFAGSGGTVFLCTSAIEG